MDWQLLRVEVTLGVLIGLLLGVLLLSFRPQDRVPVRNLLLVLGLLLVLELLGQALLAWDLPRVGRLLSGTATVGIGAVVIRLFCVLLFRVGLPLLHLSPARIVEDLVTTVLAAGWLLFWLHGVGLDLGSLLATSAVITAVLAFSMQDTLGNILGGVVLQLDDSLRVGDWITIDGINGRVVDVRWRHTALETRDRETVIVPNGWMVKNRFTVIGSRNDPRPIWRRWVRLNVDWSVPPGRVCEVLETAVRDAEIPNVLHEPPPHAVVLEIAQGYARYGLRYWLSEPRLNEPTDSAVAMHALAALARHGIRLAVVQEERLVIQEDAARHAALQEVELKRRQRALAGVELFASLSDGERSTLAAALVNAPFAQGDTITRQGAVAHWLYLIGSGEADVWAEGSGGTRAHIATLGAGEVFGEMGLMTGEPRGATVSARTDMQCYRLDKAAFESILRARPDLADELSSVIAARRGALDNAREAVRGSGKAEAPNEAIRQRILRFFGIEKD